MTAQNERPASGSDADERKDPVSKPGHLPMTELLFERQGAASPFGEDQQFPLPVDQLPYVHPQATRE